MLLKHYVNNHCYKTFECCSMFVFLLFSSPIFCVMLEKSVASFCLVSY